MSILLSYLFLFIESEDKYTSPSKDGNDMGQVKKKIKKRKKLDGDLIGLNHCNMYKCNDHPQFLLKEMCLSFV